MRMVQREDKLMAEMWLFESRRSMEPLRGAGAGQKGASLLAAAEIFLVRYYSCSQRRRLRIKSVAATSHQQELVRHRPSSPVLAAEMC